MFYYERQNELDGRPGFDLDGMLDLMSGAVAGLRDEPGLKDATARIEFDVVLPTKERVVEEGKKRKKTIRAVHEQDAALSALHHADSLFCQMFQQDQQYLKAVWPTAPSFEGVVVKHEPSDPEGMVRSMRRVVSPEFKLDGEFDTIMSYFAYVLFDSEEACHYDAVTARVTLADSVGIELPLSREKKERKYSMDAVQAWYSRPEVARYLFEACENREVLFSFSNRSRPGITVDPLGWLGVLLSEEAGEPYKPSRKDKVVLEFSTPEDISDAVFRHGLVDIIPAGNKKEERVVRRISLETDPGDLFQKILGKDKAWRANTYVAQKMCRVLDRYGIRYLCKFSGNKGWHVEMDVRMAEPPAEYRRVVEFIAAQVMDDDKASQLELSKCKEYADPFFFARRFADVVGAKVMFSSLPGLLKEGILGLDDLRKLSVPVREVTDREYETELWKYRKSVDSKADSVPWVVESGGKKYKVKFSDLVSINPYSKLKRTTKLLVDHSSNKYRGKLRALYSVNPKSGCVSVPAPHEREKGWFSFSSPAWDLDRMKDVSLVDHAAGGLDGNDEPIPYDWAGLAKDAKPNKGVQPFERFCRDNRDWFYYLLKNGAESLELKEDYTGLWVEGYIWDSENKNRVKEAAEAVSSVKDPGKSAVPSFSERNGVLEKNKCFFQAYLNRYESAASTIKQYIPFVKDKMTRLQAASGDPKAISQLSSSLPVLERFLGVDVEVVDTAAVLGSVYAVVQEFVSQYWSEPVIYELKKDLLVCNQTVRKVMSRAD